MTSLTSRLPWRRRKTPPPRVLLEHGAIPWLLAIAVATTLPHAANLPPWLSLLCGAALGGRAWLWRSNGRLPRRWALMLLVLAGTGGIAWHYSALFGHDPGVALLVFFMATKPMEMTSRRDGLVVVMLGFFLLLTHYFNSEDIATGAWLLVSATLLTAALLRIHGGARPVGGQFRDAALLIAQSLPFMLIFFLFFPRVQGPLWGMPRDTYSGLTGLAEQISPGSLDSLIRSGETAFGARFAGEVPDRSLLYWRGPVLDSYDGNTWRASFAGSPYTKANPPAIETAKGEDGAGIDYTLTLEPHNRRWLLALDLPVVLPKDASLTPALVALSRAPIRYRTRFAFRSAPRYAANREEEPRLLEQAARLPNGLNPRARELAESWRQAADGDPARISAAALRYFRQEPFFYTLQPPLLGRNAIDEFLFDTRRGFCEHYASAYVVLMRAAGIPARIVTGYQGGELNPVDNYLTVRQSDAHAWAEIWIAGQGWKRVDPTAAVAPSRIEGGLDAALPAGEALAPARFTFSWMGYLRYRWEAVNNAWDQWVLGYTPDRQRETLSRFGLDDPDWRSMVLSMASACGLVLLAAALWAFVRRARFPVEVRLWNGFCARLERLGLARAPWEGPLALADRAARERPEVATLTRRAAAYFAELRYGMEETTRRENLEALRGCVRELGAFRR